jgi:hypothetical protein
MSLVHEALRKAEREKQLKAGTAPSAPPAPHQPAPPQPPAQAHTPVVHTPAEATPDAPVMRGLHPQPQTPVAEQPREGNHYLLPALIGCVAIAAIIAIVFLVSNASSVLRQTKENGPVAATAAAPTPVAQPAAPVDPSATAPSVAPPTADSAPTPNAAPAVLPADESKYKISGIMKDPDGKPVAVINGRVAYEGYYVDGATVEKIETDRVTLDIRGQKALLRLH